MCYKDGMKKLSFIFILSLFFTLSIFARDILFIGDSHSAGPMGRELVKMMREQFFTTNNTFSLYGSCGSIARSWFINWETPCGFYSAPHGEKPVLTNKSKTPNFLDLLQKHKPDTVIVELATNYVRYDENVAIRDMKKITKAIKDNGSECLWVSAPHMRKFEKDLDRLFNLVQKAIGSECKILRSDLFTKYPEVGSDGIHYSDKVGKDQAILWAQEIANFIQ